MPVYVDKPMPIGGRYNNYCHCWADSDAELHAFADRLHLPRTWLQISRGMTGDFKHYDLSPSKRFDALKAGAQYMPLVDWLRKRDQSTERSVIKMAEQGKPPQGRPQRQSFPQAMAHKVAGLLARNVFLQDENQRLREALARIAGGETDAVTIARLALMSSPFSASADEDDQRPTDPGSKA